MKLFLKTCTLVFLFFISINTSYSQQNTNGWYWINGQPQGNTLHWTQIVDATHYYAVGEEGTFMKSTDGGDTWIINTAAGIIDPMFGSGGTFRLYTGWFFDANTGLVAGQSASGDGGFVRRTTDGGETFTSINLGNFVSINRISDMYFINSNTGFLSGNNNTKAYKTTNAGLNWTLLPNLPVATYNYNCIYASDENNIIIGLSSEGTSRHILRTTNGGTTWLDETLPGTVPVDFKDVKFQNANTGYICGQAGANSYIAVTVNGGANWVQSVFNNNQQGLYALQVVGSTVYTLGSYTKYFYSNNLGASWDSVNFSDPSNLNQPYQFIVTAFDFNGNDQIVVGYNGKVNVSYDGGSTWRNKNYSVGYGYVSFPCVFSLPGTGHLWSGGQSGLILSSTNNGTNWTPSFTSALYSFKDLEMLNTSTGYAVGGDLLAGKGYCYKTTDGGINWTSLNIPTPNTPIYGLSFANVNTGWIFGGYPFGSPAVVSKTTDGGATWINQSTTPVLDGTLVGGDFVDANTGYCNGGGLLWKTTNGGTNWNVLSFPGSNPRTIKVLSASTIFAGGGQDVYKSFDGGATWSAPVSINTVANIFNMDWYDENNGIVVGTAGYTAKTKDGGLTWAERNPGSSTITGVSMPSKDTVFASCDRNVTGAIFRLYDVSNSITLNLTIGIQGFWNGTTQVGDTVECHLRNSTAPYNEVEVASAVMNNSGYASFEFTSAPDDSYYIEITHRNSLETWSASPIPVSVGGSYNYNFTTAASQAYGNNLILTSGRYCNYSGDVTQEGSVDLNDVVNVNNASSVFTTGYVVQDVTGDNLVDLSDLIITFNNASMFVTKITP